MTRPGKETPFLTKAYALACRCWVKLFSASRILFAGFWLGVLPRSAFDLIDELYYNSEDLCFSEVYNKRGLYQWEEDIIEKYLKGCRHILAGAVGGGREVLALSRLGYDVDAFECNPLLVKRANELLEREGFNSRVALTRRDRCMDIKKMYDGIVVGWGAFSHIQTRKQRVNFLKDLRAVIKEGAPVLVSFLHRTDTGHRYRAIVFMANILKRLLRRKDYIEPGDNLMLGNKIFNIAHYFTEEEIHGEMKDAGFKLDFYSTDLYGHAVGLALNTTSHTY